MLFILTNTQRCNIPYYVSCSKKYYKRKYKQIKIKHFFKLYDKINKITNEFSTTMHYGNQIYKLRYKQCKTHNNEPSN